MLHHSRTPRSTQTPSPLALRWLTLLCVTLLVVGCGGVSGSGGGSSESGASADSSEAGTWFEIRGSRSVDARPARASIFRMAELPLFEDDHPGLLLKVQEDGPKLSKASRVEIFPLPDPPVPGEYPLVEASSSPDGTIGASVTLPKDQEKVFLPMAIYGEEVVGTLTLLDAPDGTLRGRFTVEARLDAHAAEPAVTATGEFEGVVIPAAR